MAWENCVDSIRKNLSSTAKEEKDINWKSVPQNDLDDDNFDKGSPYYMIFPDRHCNGANQTPRAHSLCKCKDINNQPIPDCTPPSALYPFKAGIGIDIDNPGNYSSDRGRTCMRKGDSFYPLTCYCCCSCYANGTKIAIPNGDKVIEDFVVGNKVLAANVVSNSKYDWRPQNVSYSFGTGDDAEQSSMIYMHYGPYDHQMIVSTDQLVKLSNGKLKRADRLVPDKDQLVSKDGEAIVLHEVSLGAYKGGVHHIATSNEYDGSLDGHLLLSEGIVSGDFDLQIHSQDLVEKGLLEDYKNQPVIGSDEYKAANNNLVSTVLAANVTKDKKADSKPQKPLTFYVYGENTVSIPESAAAYLYNTQSIDVNDKAERWGFSEIGNKSAMVKYLLTLFKGFNPDINFYYDISNTVPNTYAFEQNGQKHIVITGGLVRIKSLEQEGLSFILAAMIARLHKIAPRGKDDWTSVAMADYYSVNYLTHLDLVMLLYIKQVLVNLRRVYLITLVKVTTYIKAIHIPLV